MLTFLALGVDHTLLLPIQFSPVQYCTVHNFMLYYLRRSFVGQSAISNSYCALAVPRNIPMLGSIGDVSF